MVLAIQDHFVDTCLIEMLHTSNMLRPSTPALVTITNGMGADDSTNGQQQLTEYFPELIIVHNKAQLEDFSPSRIRKAQKFYSNVFAKQSQVGQINWKYDTGLVRMTKALSHLNHDICSGPGQNVNLFFVPDLELSNAGNYQMRRNKSCEMCAVPEISYEKLTSELRRRVLAVPPRPLNTVGKLTEKTWLNHAQKAWDNIKSSSFYVEYGRILTNS